MFLKYEDLFAKVKKADKKEIDSQQLILKTCHYIISD